MDANPVFVREDIFMDHLTEKEIASYLKKNIKLDNSVDGPIYRCSAILTDGTFLSCVIFQEIEKKVNLAIKRFDETRADKSLHKSVGYRAIVESFVCNGNRLSSWVIKELQPCPYAISGERVSEIGGETSMGWTEFICEMEDGKTFCFGTTFDIWFFEMPEGYSADRILKVTPAIRGKRSHDRVYREKPYFTCYLPEKLV